MKSRCAVTDSKQLDRSSAQPKCLLWKTRFEQAEDRRDSWEASRLTDFEVLIEARWLWLVTDLWLWSCRFWQDTKFTDTSNRHRVASTEAECSVHMKEWPVQIDLDELKVVHKLHHCFQIRCIIGNRLLPLSGTGFLDIRCELSLPRPRHQVRALSIRKLGTPGHGLALTLKVCVQQKS